MQEKPVKLWKIIAGLLLAFVGFVVANVLSQLTASLLLAAGLPYMLCIVLYAVLEIAMLSAWLAFVCRLPFPTRLARYHLRLREGKSWLMLALGLGIGAAALLLVCLPLYLGGQYTFGPGQQSLVLVLLGLVEFVAVGWCEELLCRGYMQHHLLRFGPVGALCIVSGLFSLMHFFNPSFSLLAFINIFLAGTFMGAALYATGSLMAAIGIHITWNWMQGSVLGIAVSGGESDGFFATAITGSNAVLTGGEFGAEGSVVCTIVLALLTVLLLFIAYKNGNIKKFTALAPEGVKAG